MMSKLRNEQCRQTRDANYIRGLISETLCNYGGLSHTYGTRGSCKSTSISYRQQLSSTGPCTNMHDVTLTMFSDWLFNMAEAASAVSLPTLYTTFDPRTEKRTSKEKAYVHAHVESPIFSSKKKTSFEQVVRDLEQLPNAKRWTYIKQHKLCKNCLELHHFLSCTDKNQCGTDGCTLRHNKMLHDAYCVDRAA